MTTKKAFGYALISVPFIVVLFAIGIMVGENVSIPIAIIIAFICIAVGSILLTGDEKK